MKQWQAVFFPLSLTSFMYVGSMVLKSLLLVDSWREHMNHGGDSLLNCARMLWTRVLDWGLSTVSNILAWRNYVVVSNFKLFHSIFGSMLRVRANKSLILSFIVAPCAE